ncbi:oligosaccharide flippase family protein [Pusillimonas sp. SM2304]|nr:oligosaccharide flippase family protein [Pusillimonas sp. SM2304]MDS1140041.1 oligosaccharide flippase family protein [Pusillimonas sp. SM2304]
MIVNILNAAIPFMLLPILTRYLSTTEYGVVAMFQTFVAALSAFTGLSVHGAALRKFYDLSEDKTELKDYIGACLQILLLSSSIIFLLVFFVSDYLSTLFGLNHGWLLVAVIVSAASFVVNIRMGQWQVRNSILKYSAFLLSQSLVNLSLSLLLVIVLKLGGEGRLIAMAWTPVLFAGVALFSLGRCNLIGTSWHVNHVKEALRFGVPLIPHVAGAFLLLTIDRLVVNTKLGLGQAGIYMAAIQVSMIASICFDAINKAFVPWLYERLSRNLIEEKQLIVKWTYIYFVFLLGLAIVGFYVGPYFIFILTGPNYQAAQEIIGWLLLGQIFKGMYLMVTNYVFFAKKTVYLSVVTMISGLLNVLFLFLLIDYLGLHGAAIATALAGAVQFLLTWYAANRSFQMPWTSLKVWSRP